MSPKDPNDPAVATSPGAPRREAGGRLIEKIDICRGLFAFLVVAAHAYDVCWIIHPESVGALPEPIRKLLHCTLRDGFYWVMGFFAISGYCIQLSVGRLLDEGRFTTGHYLTARLTRIFPLYYAGLVFTLAVELLVAPIRPPFYPDGLGYVGWISQMFFAQRFFQTFGSFAPSWTITYELFYYILFGAIAAFAAGRKARAPWVGLALSVVIGSAMQWFYLNGGHNPVTLHLGLIFGFGTIWFFGALIAVHGPSLVQSRVVRILCRFWPLGLVSAVLMSGSGQFPMQFVYLVVGGSLTIMLLQFHAEDFEQPTERRKPAWFVSTSKVLGLASYPTYLFHGPILLLIATAISHWGLVESWWVTWLILVGSGVGAGLALGWLAERPIMAWRADFLKRLGENPASSSVAKPGKILGISR